MDCLDNLIALDHTCAGDSNPVMTLQSIGITEKNLAEIMNGDETPAMLLANVEQLARKVVRNDVITHFADRIIPRTIIDAEGLGHPDEKQEVLTGGAGQRGGIVIELGESKSNQVLRFSEVGLWMPGPGATPYTIEAYDLSDGSVVDSITIDAGGDVQVHQHVQIVLPARRKRKSYFIATDATSFYRVNMSATSTCATCSGALSFGTCYVWGGRIAASVPMRRSNIQSASHTSGIMLTATVECDHAAILCEVRDLLALPYLYKVGHLLMERALYAFDRLNSHTIDKEALAMRHDSFGQQYVAAMNNVLGKMRLPDDPTCFICHQRTRSITAIP
jgi:hypothetical protein